MGPTGVGKVPGKWNTGSPFPRVCVNGSSGIQPIKWYFPGARNAWLKGTGNPSQAFRFDNPKLNPLQLASAISCTTFSISLTCLEKNSMNTGSSLSKNSLRLNFFSSPC